MNKSENQFSEPLIPDTMVYSKVLPFQKKKFGDNEVPPLPNNFFENTVGNPFFFKRYNFFLEL